MAQIVKNYCDNPKCDREIKSYRVRLSFEYSSRSHYGREYCHTFCMIEDLDNFENSAKRSDLSS